MQQFPVYWNTFTSIDTNWNKRWSGLYNHPDGHRQGAAQGIWIFFLQSTCAEVSAAPWKCVSYYWRQLDTVDVDKSWSMQPVQAPNASPHMQEYKGQRKPTESVTTDERSSRDSDSFYKCSFPFIKRVDRLPREQTYVIAAWKRKRQNAKTLTSGEEAIWLIDWQEAGVPASVHTHPVFGGEENPSVMSEDTKSACEH